MAENFGAGVTHYPALNSPDEDLDFPMHRTLASEEHLRRNGKPHELAGGYKAGFGDDKGFAAGQRHRLVVGFLVR